MRITAARTTVVGTPWRELVFLELDTDTGLTGVSEVRMVSRTDTLLACLDELAPRHVIGTDPFDVERLAWNIQRAEYDRPGEVSQSALASFDVACWDLIGQSLGVPVWKLLGGKFHARVPAYANGWYQTERHPAKIGALAAAVCGENRPCISSMICTSGPTASRTAARIAMAVRRSAADNSALA